MSGTPVEHLGDVGADTSTDRLELLTTDDDEPVPATPTLVDAPIVEHRALADRYWLLRLRAPAVASHARPGQFVMLTVAHADEPGPVLPRPMAIYAVDREGGTFDVVYGVVGSGTRHLTSFVSGQAITTVGPLGRPFVLHRVTRRILLVGRGIGTCSLTALALMAAGRGVETTALDSARHPAALIGDRAYGRASLRALIQVTDSTGTSAPSQVRRQLVRELDPQAPEQIFVCGSRRLTDLCAALGRRWDAEVQVCVEAHMACGLGYCHGCSTGTRSAQAEAPLVCRDGPVFLWSRSEGNAH